MSAATTVHDGKVVTRTDRGAPAGPLLLALFAVLYLGALFFRHLWPVDETRYAEVAREMGERGSFLLPVLKGAVYTDKPPLLFWLMLALHAVGVPFSLAGRLLSVASALVTLALVTRRTARRFGARASLWSGWILGSGLLYGAFASTGMFDPLLTLWVTIALLALDDAFAAEGSARSRAAFWAGALALALLTKGPVAFVFTVAVGLAALALPARVGWPPGARRRAGLVIGAGTASGLVLAALWFVPAVRSGGEAYAGSVLLRQTAGRVFESWAHARPWYFYLLTAPLALLPWSGYAGGLLRRPDRAGAPGRGSAGLFAVAALLPFLVFTVISGKQVHYLIPAFPAFAMLLGSRLAAAEEAERPPRWWRVGTALHLAGWSVAGLACLLAPVTATRAVGFLRPAWEENALAARILSQTDGDPFPALLGLGFLVIAALGWRAYDAAVRGGRKAPRRAAAHAQFAAVALFMLVLNTAGAARLDPLFSGRALGRELGELEARGCRIAVYGGSHGALFHYLLARASLPELDSPSELAAFLAGEEPCVVVGRAGALRKAAAIGGTLHALTDGFAGGRRYLVVGNAAVR